MTSETNKIMTKPLPQILSEIEDSIQLANEAGRNAREAANDARKAASDAAREAASAAAEKIAKVEKIANKALQLSQLVSLAVMDEAAAIEKRLSGKAVAIESAPPQEK